VETAYLHTDSSGYWWGAVHNSHSKEAMGFWSECNKAENITWKELHATMLAVQTFLQHMAFRNVSLHEENHSVCDIMAGPTSRSSAMTTES
jgi:hypothetical protein